MHKSTDMSLQNCVNSDPMIFACLHTKDVSHTKLRQKKMNFRFAIILTQISAHSIRNKHATDKETEFAILAQISAHTSINKRAHDKETNC